jgi:putative transposase
VGAAAARRQAYVDLHCRADPKVLEGPRCAAGARDDQAQAAPVRPYATRKPRDYQAHLPGDLVQVDNLDVRPLPHVHFKQFTARDMNSRWDVVEAYRSATAVNARKFLDTLIERAPFPVRGIQVDGGSKFIAQFEQAYADKNIRLFVLPPRSPKLNGQVEWAQRAHTEELYDLYMGELDLKSANEALREWETFGSIGCS